MKTTLETQAETAERRRLQLAATRPERRERIATAVLSGMLSGYGNNDTDFLQHDGLAIDVLLYTDALIAALDAE